MKKELEIKNLVGKKRQKFACSWSGGKDSCIAMYKAVKEGYSPKVAITAFIEDGTKSRSHGVDSKIIDLQMESIGICSEKIYTSWNNYEEKFIEKLKYIKEKFNINTVVFGDIDLEPHREWEEMVCRKANLDASLPLWLEKRESIINQFLSNGFKALIVAVNTEKLSTKYLGKLLTYDLVEELKKDGSDACGENGEYHTIVIDGPLFSFPINLKIGKIYSHSGHSFIETKVEKK